jgi:hypothetical protein
VPIVINFQRSQQMAGEKLEAFVRHAAVVWCRLPAGV